MVMKHLVSRLEKRFSALSPAVQASIAYMICTVVQKGSSILTTPIFTRLLTTEQYGYYNVFHSWLAVVKIFSTLLLAGTVYMQALVKFQKDKDQMTSAIAGLGTTTTLIVSLVYFLFRDQFNALMHVDSFIMTCILITAWGELLFDLWAVQQRVEFHFKALVILTLVLTLLKPLISICAILSTDQWKAEARILSSVLVDTIAYSWFFFRFLRRGKTFFHYQYWKYFLSFSIPLIPHYLTRIILNHSDRLMIQMMVGYSEAGIYSLAHNLAWMLTLVTQALLNTVSPWIFQRIKAHEFKQITRPSYLIMGLVAGAGLCLTAIAPEIVRFFAPADYSDAVWIIPPLVASVYFTFLYSVFSNYEYYYEAKKNILFASLFVGVLNIILNYVFILLFGYIATGYTTLICFIFLSVTHYWSMTRVLHKHESNIAVYQLKPILMISTIFLTASLGCMLIYHLPLIRYLLLGGSLIVLFMKKDDLLSRFKELRK